MQLFDLCENGSAKGSFYIFIKIKIKIHILKIFPFFLYSIFHSKLAYQWNSVYVVEYIPVELKKKIKIYILLVVSSCLENELLQFFLHSIFHLLWIWKYVFIEKQYSF
jgi:hypothetical protein